MAKLRDIWQSSVQQGDVNERTQIDILAGLNQMTLDVIGMAGVWTFRLKRITGNDIVNLFCSTGFGYRFDGLTPSGKNNPLRSALNEILNPSAFSSRLALVQAFIPFFRWVVSTIFLGHL